MINSVVDSMLFLFYAKWNNEIFIDIYSELVEVCAAKIKSDLIYQKLQKICSIKFHSKSFIDN